MSRLRTPWRAVAAMFILNGGLLGVWASRIPGIAEKHALDKAELGLLLLLLACGAIVAFPIAGRSADRFGAAPVTLTIGAAYALSVVFLALSPTVPILAISLFLFGVCHGSMDVTMNTWAGEVERHMDRTVMSSFHAMFSLGAGLGAGSGYLAGVFELGLVAHMTLASIFFAIPTFAMATIGWQSPKHAPADGPVFAIPKGALLGAGVLTFCAALGEGALADWSAIFLVNVTGAAEGPAALGFAAFSVTMVAMRLSVDHLIRWTGPECMVLFSGLAAATGVLLAVIPATYGMSLVGFMLMGVGYAAIFPLAFSRAANDPNIPPGAAIASVATLGYGGLLLGPPVIGFVAQLTSLRLAFVVIAVLAVTIAIFAKAVRPAN